MLHIVPLSYHPVFEDSGRNYSLGCHQLYHGWGQLTVTETCRRKGHGAGLVSCPVLPFPLLSTVPPRSLASVIPYVLSGLDRVKVALELSQSPIANAKPPSPPGMRRINPPQHQQEGPSWINRASAAGATTISNRYISSFFRPQRACGVIVLRRTRFDMLLGIRDLRPGLREQIAPPPPCPAPLVFASCRINHLASYGAIMWHQSSPSLCVLRLMVPTAPPRR